MTTDETTAFVSTFDDILQMLASLEHRDAGDEHMAKKLASGLTPERQSVAMSNITRVLVNLLAEELNEGGDEIYHRVRSSVIPLLTN